MSTEEGVDLAEELGYMFFETSAKTGLRVNESFTSLSDMIVAKIEDDMIGLYDTYKQSLY